MKGDDYKAVRDPPTAHDRRDFIHARQALPVLPVL